MRVSMKQHLASPGGRGNHGNSGTGQPPAPVTLIDSVEYITHYPYVLFTGELVGGTMDRAAVRETQHGYHATQMCPMAHWATTSQLSSPVSSQRLGHGKSSGGYMTLQCSTPPHSKCHAPSQLFAPDSQPRHDDSNSSGGSAIVTHCDN